MHKVEHPDAMNHCKLTCMTYCHSHKLQLYVLNLSQVQAIAMQDCHATKTAEAAASHTNEQICARSPWRICGW